MEIERKFLVQTLPTDLKKHKHAYIEQAYISSDPVIRIRQKAEQYYLTVKSKGHLIREEYEMEITEAQYTKLLSKVEGHIIKKTRYFIPLNNSDLTAELDVFEDIYDGLVLVEVEFPTESEANSFTPPDWFGKDVSYDSSYKNSSLSSRN